VVIVDAKKFLALWRAGPEGLQRDIANGNPETWRHDRRFIDATDGFSYGFKNPVPLAQVGYFDGKLTSVSEKPPRKPVLNSGGNSTGRLNGERVSRGEGSGSLSRH
jgi:hypothetical protein